MKLKREKEMEDECCHGNKRSGVKWRDHLLRPFSLIMLTSSMINLPSLYFWLVSYAVSYFHPNTLLQDIQMMSAMECRPVSNSRSSGSPIVMLQTSLKR